jgi:hypothetical protein
LHLPDWHQEIKVKVLSACYTTYSMVTVHAAARIVLRADLLLDRETFDSYPIVHCVSLDAPLTDFILLFKKSSLSKSNPRHCRIKVIAAMIAID